MKHLLAFVLLMAGADMAFAQSQAAGRYPFCMTGRDFAGVGDCIYDTFAQCQASASGREASCRANPYFVARQEPVATPAPPPEPRAAQKKRSQPPQAQPR